MKLERLGKIVAEIDIKDCILVARGGMRNVYEHRDLPGLLIKTMRPDIVDAAGYFRRNYRIKRLRPIGSYYVFQRELTEFIIHCRRRLGRDMTRLPFTRPTGLVVTTHGLGIVVEKVASLSGGLAPTLRTLVNAKEFGERHLHALERFFRECRDQHVVLGDVNAGNIVYSEVRDPRGEFICVDGIGESAAIPVHRWVRYFNTRKIERVRRRLLTFAGQAVSSRLELPGRYGDGEQAAPLGGLFGAMPRLVDALSSRLGIRR